MVVVDVELELVEVLDVEVEVLVELLDVEVELLVEVEELEVLVEVLLEEVEVEVTESVDSTLALLGLGSFLSCLGADDTSSDTVAGTATAGTVESAEVAEVDLDVLTI